MTELRLLADDLTGAMDTAAQFVGLALGVALVAVLFGRPTSPGGDPVVPHGEHHPLPTAAGGRPLPSVAQEQEQEAVRP